VAFDTVDYPICSPFLWGVSSGCLLQSSAVFLIVSGVCHSLLFFVVVVDFVWAFGLLNEEQGWLSCFHVLKRDVAITHSCSGSHGGL